MDAEQILDQAGNYAELVARTPPPCSPLCRKHPCSSVCARYEEPRNPSESWDDYITQQERWDKEVLAPYLARWNTPV